MADSPTLDSDPDKKSHISLQAINTPNLEPTDVPAWDSKLLIVAHRQYGPVAGMLWVAEAGLLIWFIGIWKVVLTQPAKLFTFHPLLQSFAILSFYQGILVLQPTKTPAQKRAGLSVHEVFQITGAVAITAGTVIMIVNKLLHNSPHFKSWHGLLGFITACLLVIQSCFGGLIGFEWSRKLILGESRARSLWKYHRASGYILIILITLTFLTATKSEWFKMVSSTSERYVLACASIVSAVGLLARTNIRKIIPARARAS
ncbi:uncharacterized protein MELLADRAFT_70886 [Melampsora larici-populina 98AG31]|uniref:Cytochrome b561 domain-containing protein n=1 Tax=Melampsora larici-populina (strain 98AG31 / pathotype 3-4-7) TaxID=747676 RepID=F4R955_MELLP|nr:uncharacterized protein MELLADRAFT_70886 [Melampsora larici-populina 98AG31]EGG11212.1 hypothetical protein MELLADRAFT_70886 [Melampsora larici-populina 98AG31]